MCSPRPRATAPTSCCHAHGSSRIPPPPSHPDSARVRHMPEYPMDTTVTDHLLATTRAVRRRLDLERPVEREVLLECLRLAVQAPTGSNSQNWHWGVVPDPAKRGSVTDVHAGVR